MIQIRELTSAEVATRSSLSDLLVEAVSKGASLGFLSPLAFEDAQTYWHSLADDIASGSRLVLAAFDGDELVGSGQLVLPRWPNARHRAEVQKVFVASSARGKGVGSTIMRALHECARQRDRSLLLLNTRHGENNEHFYKRQGYREVGIIPGYTVGAAGERYDNLTLYLELTG